MLSREKALREGDKYFSKEATITKEHFANYTH